MEINVTEFVENECMSDYSASAMEKGQDVGQVTWQACVEATEDFNYLDNDEKRQACRDHFFAYGAWSMTRINKWTDKELNAIFLQDIAAAKRELDNYDDIEAAIKNGQVSGRLYPDSWENPKEWYFYLGM